MIQKVKFFATGLWVDRHLGQWITVIMVMIHVGLGTAIISGSSKRFAPPSYEPLIDYVDGHIWIWAAWIVASAIFMATPFRPANIFGLWLGMVWHIVWMGAFMVAAAHHEDAAATPIPVYGGMAMICAALLTARVIDKTEA